jgi:hypothetical protein
MLEGLSFRSIWPQLGREITPKRGIGTAGTLAALGRFLCARKTHWRRTMRQLALAGAMTALALVGSSAAQAQVVVEQPTVVAPGAYVAPYAAAPTYVVPVPGYAAVAPPAAYVAPGYSYGYAPGYSYGYAQPYAAAPVVTSDGYVTVNSYTGRRCTVQPDGYHWCWTP